MTICDCIFCRQARDRGSFSAYGNPVSKGVRCNCPACLADRAFAAAAEKQKPAPKPATYHFTLKPGETLVVDVLAAA